MNLPKIFYSQLVMYWHNMHAKIGKWFFLYKKILSYFTNLRWLVSLKGSLNFCRDPGKELSSKTPPSFIICKTSKTSLSHKQNKKRCPFYRQKNIRPAHLLPKCPAHWMPAEVHWANKVARMQSLRFDMVDTPDDSLLLFHHGNQNKNAL